MKAKQLHPDINPSPNAHEEFLLLYEAFDTLINKKNVSKPANNKSKNTYNKKQEYTRQAAEKAAQMRYNEWINSEEYQNLINVTNIGDSCGVTLIYLVCLIVPSFQGYVSGEIIGALIGLSIGITIIFFLRKYTVIKGKLQPLKAYKSFIKLAHISGILYFLLFTGNFVIFFAIGLSTAIWLSLLLSSYLISFAIFFLLHKRKIIHQNIFKQLSLAGSIISLFLTINYFTSNNRWEETHYFELIKQDDTLIEFKDNDLNNYLGVRLFRAVNFGERPYAVKYTFEKGGLGFDVVKSYEFIAEEN